MKQSPMRRFLQRFFAKPAAAPKSAPDGGGTHRSLHGNDTTSHDGFRTKRGDGPFLLSCDGRVIPLRKARFLRGR